MLSVRFKSSLVEQRNGEIVIVAFDGWSDPVAIVLLRCDADAARSLCENLRSAIKYHSKQ